MSLVEQNSSVPVLASDIDPYEALSMSARPTWNGPKRVGFLVIAAFFGGFGTFAAMTPIESSVMAPGEVRVDSERKLVQHPTGGVVTDILVHEGEHVESGQLLVRLSTIRDQAAFSSLTKRHLSALATRARLFAERDGRQTVTFPKELLESTDPAAKDILENESKIFESRRASVTGQTQLYLEQIDQLRTTIAATKEQRAAIDDQLALIEKELTGVRELYEKGLERLPRLLSLQRQAASLKGERGRMTGLLANSEKQIGETELRIVQVQKDFERDVVAQLDRATDDLQQVEEQLPVSRDTLQRNDILAPRSGTIVDMKVHTIGGVVRGSETMMQIVPDSDDLIVVAKVKQTDIDHVNKGVEKAQVRLTAFSQRFTHPVEARVESVSTDIIHDESTGPMGERGYYRVILRLSKESLDHVLPGAVLTSGMPALAMLAVGKRTLLEYFTEPLYLSVVTSLREP